MPIVTHTLQTSMQADGSSNNILRMYDQDGIEYMQGFHAPAGFNLDTKVTIARAELDEQLATAEFNALIGL